jgi:dolichol-phosphate mannosyltransferase
MSVPHGDRPRRTAVVVIPTYNEADSIGAMVDCLCGEVLPSLEGWSAFLLVVDGRSPDGTAGVVESRMPKYPNLKLVVEEGKRGIGAAYFTGFEYAVEELGADAVIEFDGDFQHPPRSIPELLAKIDEGADCVLGSRKVPGGSYPRGWGFKRLLFSKFGGFVARVLLFFPGAAFRSVTDPTTGLKATRVEGCLDRLDFSSFLSRGFGYKLEMLYKIIENGGKIAEIPLAFGLREQGASKITSQTPKEIFGTILVLRTRSPSFRRFLKFAVVGFCGFLVNSICLEAFSGAGFVASIAEFFSRAAARLAILGRRSTWAAAIATEVSIISNFALNSIWTFKAEGGGKAVSVAGRFLLFNLSSLGAIVLQSAAVGVAVMIFSETTMVRQIALVLSIGFLVVPYNWIMYNKIVWKVRLSNK